MEKPKLAKISLGVLVKIIRQPTAWLLLSSVVFLMPKVLGAPPCDAPVSGDTVLCLESDQDVTSNGGVVSAWADQSGSGNDVTSGGTPTIGAVTTPTGEPAISFDGGGAIGGSGVDYSWITAPTSDVSGPLSNTFASVDEWPFVAADLQSVALTAGAPSGTHIWGFPDMSTGPGENKGWRLLVAMSTSSGTSSIDVVATLRNNGSVISTHPTVRISSMSTNIYAFFFPDVDTSSTTFDVPQIGLNFTRVGGNTSFRVGGLLLSRSPIEAADEAVGYGALTNTEVQAFRANDLMRLGGFDGEVIVHWPDATGRGQHLGVVDSADNATLQISGSTSWVNFDSARLAGVLDSAVTGDLVRMTRYRFETTTGDHGVVSQAETGGAGAEGGKYFGRWDNSTPKLATSPGITDKIVTAGGDGGGAGFAHMIMAGDGSGPAHVYSAATITANTWYRRTDYVQQAANEKVWLEDDASPIIDAAGVDGTNDLMRFSVGNRESDDRPMDGDISELWHYDMTADGGRDETDLDDARDAWVASSTDIGDKLERTSSLADLPSGDGDRTMFVVAQYDSDGTGGFAYGDAVDNEAFGLGVDDGGELMVYGRGSGNNFSSATTGNGAGWMVQSVVKSGNSLSHYKDGALIDSDTHTHATVLDRIVLGANIDSDFFIESDVAAVLVYDKALDGTERQQVEDYLQAKYISSTSAPGVPQNLSATPGNQQVDLTWNAPASDGGSPITEYVVEYKLSSSGTWIDANHNSTNTNATISSLTNGSSYDFRVSATNAIGTGAATTPVSATPRTVPGVPQNLNATPGNQQVSLTWNAPASDGGSVITEYVVEYKLSSSGIWIDTNHNSTNTNAVVSSLVNGSAYDFRVSATNVAGTGSPSTVTNVVPEAVPSAPQNLNATPGNQQVGLTWTAPADDGGSPITEYVVEYKLTSSGIWIDANHNSTNTNATISSLTNGSSYDFRVSATNSVGTGPTTGTVSATPFTVPGVVQNLSATPGNQQVQLDWDPPASNGGKAITEYIVEYKQSSSGIWIDANHNSTNLTATISSLTNGTAYDFRVAAENDPGSQGGFTTLNSVTPLTTPGTPQNLNATPSNQQVGLTWDAPVSDGGSPITEYVVEYKLTSSGIWIDANHNSTNTNATVSSLTNGSSYDFRVSATNAAGTGSPTATVSATPFTMPGVPQNLNATPGNQQVALTWDAPASNGGSAITEYVVEYKLSSSGTWTDTNHNSTTTNATISSLTNGSAYDFRVSATNAAGTGSPATVTNVVPITVPTSPQNLNATPGNQQVSLTWNAPADDGGSPISEYVVEYKASSSGTWIDANHNSTLTNATISSLTNGTSYDFRVSATNATGTSLPTAPVSTTPFTVPGIPQNLAATPSDQQVGLTWDAPASNGGSAITEYVVEYKQSSSGIWIDANHNSTNTSATINSLNNGTAYDFRVSGTNAAGTGGPVTVTNIIPTATATAPLNLDATPDDRQVALDWDTPTSDGGSAITEYLVEYKLSSSGVWIDANHNSLNTDALLTGLSNGADYDFRVAAVTGNGTGSYATVVNVTPFTLVPNLGDANDDGTHDVDQPNVDGLFSPVTGDYVALEVDAGCTITAITVSEESANATADSGFDYPLGLLNFTVNCGTPNFVATVVQYYYDTEAEDYSARKYNPTSSAYFSLDDAGIAETTIDNSAVLTVAYQVVDGSERDSDGAADGIIIDPAGLGVSVVGAPNTGLGGPWFN